MEGSRRHLLRPGQRAYLEEEEDEMLARNEKDAREHKAYKEWLKTATPEEVKAMWECSISVPAPTPEEVATEEAKVEKMTGALRDMMATCERGRNTLALRILLDER